MHKSLVLNELVFRGFLSQCTNLSKLDEVLSTSKPSVYIGFDVTADSLHVGHLTQIRLLKIFQKHGYRPIILLGGGTTKIGDPTGKNKIRQMLSNEDLTKNINSIKKSFQKLLGESIDNTPIIIDNDTWLADLRYIDFLRLFGVHFSVNKMLTMDTFKQRLSNDINLSFIEFNYPLLQSFDFLELNNRYGCMLQLGGSDQWGNIVNGVDLVRRVNNIEVFGLTAPLLTTADGQKMGKSLAGAIWLNADKLNTHDFWQYWRNTHDDDVVKFIKLFTDIDENDLQKFTNLKFQGLNEAKIFLADSITKFCRGDEELKHVHSILSGNNCTIGDNTITFPMEEIVNHKTIIDLAVMSNVCSSNGEAKRLILNGGLYMNEQRVLDGQSLIKPTDVYNKQIKFSSGRKKMLLIKLQ